MRRRFPVLYKALNVVHERVFSWSGGRAFGTLRGMTSIRLTTTGRKTGLERTTMLTSPLVEDDEVVLVASYRGGPHHPAWYLNLMANPTIPVERPGFRGEMIAETLHGDERERLWRRITARQPRYEKYQSRTDRELPLVVLRPADRSRSRLVEP
ncbi:MAG: nitroreductase family deazaflavin-dependent oxidoreductase [Actinobacteria bacterium]|nr:nitroreductase family deazaflavin-dependent oxidoreductase [Actinomycetota bacterium]